MFEMLVWAFFAGCVMAAFIAPMALAYMALEWFYNRYVGKSHGSK